MSIPRTPVVQQMMQTPGASIPRTPVVQQMQMAPTQGAPMRMPGTPGMMPVQQAPQVAPMRMPGTPGMMPVQQAPQVAPWSQMGYMQSMAAPYQDPSLMVGQFQGAPQLQAASAIDEAFGGVKSARMPGTPMSVRQYYGDKKLAVAAAGSVA